MINVASVLKLNQSLRSNQPYLQARLKKVMHRRNYSVSGVSLPDNIRNLTAYDLSIANNSAKNHNGYYLIYKNQVDPNLNVWANSFIFLGYTDTRGITTNNVILGASFGGDSNNDSVFCAIPGGSNDLDIYSASAYGNSYVVYRNTIEIFSTGGITVGPATLISAGLLNQGLSLFNNRMMDISITSTSAFTKDIFYFAYERLDASDAKSYYELRGITLSTGGAFGSPYLIGNTNSFSVYNYNQSGTTVIFSSSNRQGMLKVIDVNGYPEYIFVGTTYNNNDKKDRYRYISRGKITGNEIYNNRYIGVFEKYIGNSISNTGSFSTIESDSTFSVTKTIANIKDPQAFSQVTVSDTFTDNFFKTYSFNENNNKVNVFQSYGSSHAIYIGGFTANLIFRAGSSYAFDHYYDYGLTYFNLINYSNSNNNSFNLTIDNTNANL